MTILNRNDKSVWQYLSWTIIFSGQYHHLASQFSWDRDPTNLINATFTFSQKTPESASQIEYDTCGIWDSRAQSSSKNTRKSLPMNISYRYAGPPGHSPINPLITSHTISTPCHLPLKLHKTFVRHQSKPCFNIFPPPPTTTFPHLLSSFTLREIYLLSVHAYLLYSYP